MICPWCKKEMQAGIISGDGRSRVRFQPDGVKYSFGDILAGVGILEAAQTNWVVSRIPAHYCHHCGKIVIESKVAR